MEIRPYRAGDRPACMDLFDSNVPEFFQPSERDDFRVFLDEMPGPFLLIASGAEGGVRPHVVACGGVAPEGDGSWSVCWTMVHRERHGQGVGSLLLEALVTEARSRAGAAETGAVRLRLETVPLTEAFFLRHGFRTLERIPDHYGPGLDRLEMRRDVPEQPSHPQRKEMDP